MHDVVQNAVNAETNAQLFFVRFNVDIGSSASKRVNEQDIHETHYRRVLAHPRQAGEIDLFILFKDFDFFCCAVIQIKTVQRNQIGVRKPIAAWGQFWRD